MARWLATLVLSFTAAGCYCSHVRDPDAGSFDATRPADAGIDAPLETFEGCDDPDIWEAAAIEDEPSVGIGGEACSPAQYPAHVASLSARNTYALLGDEQVRLVRSCWRVVAAHPESGWEIGRIVESSAPWLHLHVIGHERPVTFEGRLIRDDGAVRVAVRDAVVALDPPRVLEADLRELVAIGSTERTVGTTELSLARARSISVNGVERPTAGEVIGATATPSSALLWLERVGTELFARRYLGYPEPRVLSVSLGSPVEAQLAHRGAVVLLERRELVFLEQEDWTVARRVTMPADVAEVVAGWPAVLVHAAGEVVAFDGAGEELGRLAVGTGRLIPGPANHDQPSYWWDGTRIVAIDATEALAFDDSRAIALSTEERATLGEPIAVGYDAVVGTEGFVSWRAYDAGSPGPRAVSARALYGGPITHVAADTLSYAVMRLDGSASLYRVPFIDWCD